MASAPTTPDAAASTPATAASVIAAPAAPVLPTSTAALTRILDAPVVFLSAGEEGRLGVLVAEGDALVPRRFESGTWETLPLSVSHAAHATDPVGIFFGRDDRPRLMGFRRDAGTMIYLRFKDGRWKEEPSEIGKLADRSAHLFGVLGSADPEIVCRSGVLCLVKSRKGWLEVPPTLPEDAVWRVFDGTAYAATAKGLFRTGAKQFEPMGPEATWTTPPQGFVVTPDGAAIVTEPGRSLLHVLGAGATAWRTEPSPIAGPRDVAGARDARLVVGDGGLARVEGGRFQRVGDASLRLSRVVTSPNGWVVGGPSGVFVLR